MMPLTLVASGENAMVRRVGGSPEVRSHLEDMGFVAGSGVNVVSALGGNLIVTVKGVRVAIGKDMASKIMVE